LLKNTYTNKDTKDTKDTKNNNIRKIKNLTGGFDKPVEAPYKHEKNDPSLTNDERNTFKKRQAENPPREPPVLLEQKVYDTSKSKPVQQTPPPAYIPVYNDAGGIVANIPQFNNINGPNPYYQQPFQKVYNISVANPISNATTINKVFEDILPGDPRALTFNTVYERIQLKNFMRNLIIDNYDG